MDNFNSFVEEIDFNLDSLESYKKNLYTKETEKYELILDYPTVYIVNDKHKSNKYNVYIGESSDIISRTRQHLSMDSNLKQNWEDLSESETAGMYIIGNPYFNKSLTLDIENKLMHYLSSSENVNNIYNRRTNQQRKYYTSEYLEDIFKNLWESLREKNKILFPIPEVIKDSAIFKASPFHKLTQEQIDAKELIKERAISAYSEEEKGQLVLVTGEAGSGKTVLMSSLFYDLNHVGGETEAEEKLTDLSAYLLVNHDQQLTVYKEIANKLGFKSTDKSGIDLVTKPTKFINNISEEHPVDLVLIDEAHLLWTQGKQSYRGSNQLYDLLDRAKVVIAVMDFNQVLTTEQLWEETAIDKLKEITHEDNYIHLKNQMRIDANEETVRWIRTLVDYQEIYNVPEDQNYNIKIFEDPSDLYHAIKDKNSDQKQGLSRVLATYDWDYNGNRQPEDEDYWMVREGDFELPWNLQLPYKKSENRGKSWAEQEHTIDEVGSTYTIQGFDLNYAGLIIGPSVKYRDGKIIFDSEESANKKAVRNRTLADGSKQKFGENLLKNELNVLLTRGVHGIYIYAVDDELQEALLAAQRKELKNFG